MKTPSQQISGEEFLTTLPHFPRQTGFTMIRRIFEHLDTVYGDLLCNTFALKL
jgi:hypothetical protein